MIKFHIAACQLLWNPTEFSPEKYNELYGNLFLQAMNLGYNRCRLKEVIPDVGIRVNLTTSQLRSQQLRIQERIVANQIEAGLAQELSILKFATYYLNSYFKVATDRQINFSKLYIVPEPNS